MIDYLGREIAAQAERQREIEIRQRARNEEMNDLANSMSRDIAHMMEEEEREEAREMQRQMQEERIKAARELEILKSENSMKRVKAEHELSLKRALMQEQQQMEIARRKKQMEAEIAPALKLAEEEARIRAARNAETGAFAREITSDTTSMGEDVALLDAALSRYNKGSATGILGDILQPFVGFATSRGIGLTPQEKIDYQRIKDLSGAMSRKISKIRNGRNITAGEQNTIREMEMHLASAIDPSALTREERVAKMENLKSLFSDLKRHTRNKLKSMGYSLEQEKDEKFKALLIASGIFDEDPPTSSAAPVDGGPVDRGGGDGSAGRELDQRMEATNDFVNGSVGALTGVADPFVSMYETLIDGDGRVDKFRDLQQKLREESPKSYGVGNVIGQISGFALPTGMAARGIGALAKSVAATGKGAAAAKGLKAGKLANDVAAGAVVDALTGNDVLNGAMITGSLSGAGRGLSALGRGIKGAGDKVLHTNSTVRDANKMYDEALASGMDLAPRGGHDVWSGRIEKPSDMNEFMKTSRAPFIEASKNLYAKNKKTNIAQYKYANKKSGGEAVSMDGFSSAELARIQKEMPKTITKYGDLDSLLKDGAMLPAEVVQKLKSNVLEFSRKALDPDDARLAANLGAELTSRLPEAYAPANKFHAENVAGLLLPGGKSFKGKAAFNNTIKGSGNTDYGGFARLVKETSDTARHNRKNSYTAILDKLKVYSPNSFDTFVRGENFADNYLGKQARAQGALGQTLGLGIGLAPNAALNAERALGKGGAGLGAVADLLGKKTSKSSALLGRILSDGQFKD